MAGNIKNRHHVEPRVKLYSPREEPFPIPLKYIDVSRTTHTNLDVMQERPEGYMWSGERLTKRQVTSRPDHLWPEFWTKLRRNAKLKEKQKWSNEKPKLENARKLRGIYFIDPEDTEFKETIRNARKKWETPMAPAMPCKTSKKNKNGRPVARLMISSQNLRVSWKPVNPHDCAWENHYRLIIEDHIAKKRNNSLKHYNLVHEFIPMPKAMKIPAAKVAVDENGRNLKRFWRGT